MAKYQLGVIYILREGFQIYAPGLPSILEFRFVPEIVRDLDVVNKELLYSLLKMFITNNNIPKTSFIIVIADSASIIKDFITPHQTDQQAAPVTPPQQQVDEFLEHIPFEEISSKSFPIDNGIRAYGTNKELYESIKEAFLQQEFEILMALPAIAIGPEISTKTALDIDAINSILKKEPMLKEFNLLKQPAQPTQPQENPTESTENTETVKQEKKSDKKRTILLVGVFVMLIIVLVIVYINQPPM